MNQKKAILLLWTLLLPIVTLYAQNITLTGSVKANNEQKEPLSYASVVLFTSDSVYVKGEYTQNDGQFSIQFSPQKKSYYLTIQTLGYKTVSKEINPNQASTNLGTILLEPLTEMLGEVKIKANKKRVEHTIDGDIYRIDPRLAESGQSTNDMLKLLPGMMVTSDGNITLYGKTVVMKVNGVEKPLDINSRKAFLDALKAKELKSIKTSFLPDINAKGNDNNAYIDIEVDQSKVEKGVKGTIPFVGRQSTSHRDNYHMYGTSPYLTLSLGKVNLDFWMPIVNYKQLDQDNIITTTNGNTQTKTDNLLNEKFTGGNIGVAYNYYFNSLNSLGGYWACSDYLKLKKQGSKILQTQSIKDNKTIQIIQTTRNGGINKFLESTNGQLWYRHYFNNDKKSLLMLMVAYYHRNPIFDMTYKDEYLLEDLNDSEYTQIDKQSQGNYYTRANFEQKFGEKSKLSLGTDLQGNYSYRDFTVDSLINNQWVRSTTLSNGFDYDDQTYSAWIQYSQMIGKVTLQAGVKNEYTRQSGYQQELGRKDIHKYNSVLPSASVLYIPSKDHQLSINYRESVTRPSIPNLNPFVQYNDAYNISQGNPDLKASYTHDLLFQYTWKQKYKFRANYDRSNDLIASTVSIDSITNVVTNSYDNTATYDKVQLGVYVPITVCKWFDLSVDASINYENYTGEENQLHYNNTLWHPSYTVIGNFTLPHSFNIKMLSYYIGQHYMGNNRYKSAYHTDIDLYKAFKEGEYTLSFSAVDIFNHQRNEYSNGNYHYKDYLATPSFNITLAWNFKYGQKVKITHQEYDPTKERF